MEKEALEDLKRSIQERLKDLSEKLSKESDPTTKDALTNNHRKAMEELNEVNEKLRKLKNDTNE